MLKKATIFTILALLITGCVSGPDDYFKRSANNKIFDRKGFKGGKRPPLYNKKYIAQAKKNIMNGDYENDDDGDDEDTSYDNIEMYKSMIEDDLNSMNRKRKNRGGSRNSNAVYPSVVEANDRISPDTHSTNLELKEEIAQIKSMLDEAKKELASYKCPSSKDLDEEELRAPAEQSNVSRKQKPEELKVKVQEKKSALKNNYTPQSEPDNSTESLLDDSSDDSTIIEPVQSI